jgi:hypothetical protein
MKKKLPYRFISYFSQMNVENLTQHDIDLIEKFVKKHNISHCINWSEESFISKHELDNSVTECLTFEFSLKQI